MKQVFIFLIRIYRSAVSPFLGNHCRFHPSCSEYAEGALAQKGFFLGAALSIRRILRCNPLSSGGFDPIE